MNALTFEIHLLEPILATQPASGEENSATAFGFIPGSLIRGALVTRYQKQVPDAVLARHTAARALFFDEGVRFLNAYPVHPESRERMLPRPFFWFVDKDQRDDEFAPLVNLATQAGLPDDNLKKLRPEFCWLDTDHVELYTARRLVTVHNASEDPNEKAEGKSQVYRYDALAVGETFGGTIVADDLTLLNEIKQWLDQEMILGGAHTAGYGRVRIVQPQIKTNWREYASDSEHSLCVVTLLSDLILRASDGQVGKAVGLEIARQLHLPTQSPLRAFCQMRLVGGFNRTAGLPLAQEWAVQAGSTFVFGMPADVNVSIQLAEQGIGERRVDGFGRVALNWRMPDPLLRRPLSKSTAVKPEASLTSSQVLAKQMAQRMLRAKLERKLVEQVTRVQFKGTLPNNAQLSRVRTAAQQALAGKGLQDLAQLMTSLKGARQQFEQARVMGEPMLDWINARRDPAKLEHHLGMAGDTLPHVGTEFAELDAQLRNEFTARLIEGVMRKAARENQKEGANE